MNSFKCIHIDDYKNWAIKYILKNGKEIPRNLVLVSTEVEQLLESLEHMMSEDEYSFVKESINYKAILTPKLLVKDHTEIGA
jgi:hypothetical protein